MKRLLFLLMFLIPVLCFGQQGLFRTYSAPIDTSVQISSGADSWTSYWYIWDNWKTFEGAVGLWHAAYSYADGISVTIYLSYRLKCGEDNKGNNRITGWTTLDSLATTDDTSVRYGAGDQVGEVVSLAGQITNFPPNTEIQFRWNWTTSGADTVEISAVLLPIEK